MLRERDNDLLRRIEHFQEVYDSLEDLGKKYYLEKDWFDDVIQLSKEDIINEIRKSKEELEIMKSKSFLKSVLQLFHRLS